MAASLPSAPRARWPYTRTRSADSILMAHLSKGLDNCRNHPHFSSSKLLLFLPIHFM